MAVVGLGAGRPRLARRDHSSRLETAIVAVRGRQPGQRRRRLQAASGFRTAVIAGLAGLAALGSLVMAARTYRLTQQGQITDRYTKAIEQLGSDKPEVRLGGIYALERIAKDSAPDGATIAEVLTAFIRGRAPWPSARPDQPGGDTPIDEIPFLRYRAPDVQGCVQAAGAICEQVNAKMSVTVVVRQIPSLSV